MLLIQMVIQNWFAVVYVSQNLKIFSRISKYSSYTFSAIEPGIFTQEISGFDRATNISGLMKQFQWNVVCGTYLSQGM